MAVEDERVAIGFSVTLSSQLIAASMATLAVEGAYLWYALGSRHPKTGFIECAALAAFLIVVSIFKAGKGITKARNAGFNGAWNLEEGKKEFNAQASVLLVALVILGVMFSLSGEDKESAIEQKVEDLRVQVALMHTSKNQEQQPVLKLPTVDTGSSFLNNISKLALEALRAARETGADAVSLPKVAATKFVESISEESGKELVNLFSTFIKAGIGLDPDKDQKDQKVQMEKIAVLILNDSKNGMLPLVPISQPSPESKSASGILLTESVLFDTRSSVISPSSQASIQRVRDAARANPSAVLLLTGNTDTRGSTELNRRLANQRLTVVRNILISSGGISPTRVFSASVDIHSLPIITPSNTSEPKNRAVSIELRE